MDSLAEYKVSVGGKSRKVKLLRIDPKNIAMVELDGKTIKVAFPNGFGFEKLALMSVNGKNHRIKLKKNDRPTAFSVEVDGNQFNLQVEAKRRELNSNTSSLVVSPSQVLKKEKATAKTKGAVISLMPGKVVLLKVKTGDTVKVGDPLCVLEAMKMENEIVAPRDGIVTQVKVEQGSFVDKGDVLVVIE